MIPLRDANPTHRRPYVTWGLVLLNVLAFVLWQPIGPEASQPARAVEGLTRGDLFFFCHGAIPRELTQLQPVPEVAAACGGKNVPFSLFSSMFLHAGLLHIGGNMLFLWIFGNNVEDRVGHGRFLLFYLAAGVVATYAHVVTETDAVIPLVGASGAIAGVLGAYILMYPHARVLTLVFFVFITVVELPAVVVLGLWFVLQAFQGVGTLGADVPGGTAWFAHIGGFLFGLAVAALFYRRPRARAVPPGWEY